MQSWNWDFSASQDAAKSGIPGEEPPIVTGILASILSITVGVEGSAGVGAGISDPAQAGLLKVKST